MAKARGDIRQKFGARVRELRQKRTLTQEGFAGKADLDRSYMGAVERGTRNVSLLNIQKIADALGVHPSELFDFD